MPLYEYECATCHKRTEKIQKFSDPEITVCPHCGQSTLERTITAPAFQFAGGGWYKDGYGNAKPAESGGGESKGGEAKSSDSKSDTPVAAAASADSTSAPAPAAAPATPAPAAPSTPAKS